MRDQTLRTFVIRMNNQRPPLSDVDVRKGVAHAFDYDAFLEAIMKGNAFRNPVPIRVNL